jgi:hypothetical protein
MNLTFILTWIFIVVSVSKEGIPRNGKGRDRFPSQYYNPNEKGFEPYPHNQYSRYDDQIENDIAYNSPENINENYGNEPKNYDYEFINEKSFNKVPIQKPLVKKYVKTIPLIVLVAISSSLFSYIASNMILKFTLSSSPLFIIIPITIFSLLATFIPGEIGNFSRASGVFMILMFQRSNLIKFIKEFLTYLICITMITKRRGFPNLDDPWRYRPRSPKDVEFNMTYALIASAIMGAILGRVISSFIPLLPGWISTLGLAIFTGYMCTVSDPSGDLIRYISTVLMVLDIFAYKLVL